MMDIFYSVGIVYIILCVMRIIMQYATRDPELLEELDSDIKKIVPQSARGIEDLRKINIDQYQKVTNKYAWRSPAQSIAHVLCVGWIVTGCIFSEQLEFIALGAMGLMLAAMVIIPCAKKVVQAGGDTRSLSTIITQAIESSSMRALDVMFNAARVILTLMIMNNHFNIV